MAKRRATYSKELRAEAKANGHGLVTISLELPNGELIEDQRAVTVLQARFIMWASAMVLCDEVRDLPDMEKIVRELIEGNKT